MNKIMIANVLINLLGRKTAYRLGRTLYQQARGDIANNMATNGELMVQRSVIEGWNKFTIKEGGLVVFDVGANIGDWTYSLVEYFLKNNYRQSLDVYLFEPAPNTSAILSSRLQKFGSCLHFEQLALSSEEGIAPFYINLTEENAGTNSVYQQDCDSTQVNVTKTTANSFCQINKIEKIHLFKCDTEGHDMEVIRGALPLLAQERIAVFQFEYNFRWIYARNFLRDVFALIGKLPYRVAKLQSDHLLLLNEWHFELEKFIEGNYLFVHTDALVWFSTKSASFDQFNTMGVDSERTTYRYLRK